MKKNDLKKLAVMGITGGILLSQTSAYVEGAAIAGYPNPMVQAGCRSEGMYMDQSDPNMSGGEYFSSGDQGMPEGSYYQQDQGYSAYQGSQGCRAMQGSYYSTQPPGGPSSYYSDQGMPSGQQGPYYNTEAPYGQQAYYSNPNVIQGQGNQPETFRNQPNMNQNQMQNQNSKLPEMPQQMMPQGTSTQQKSSYNNNSRSRGYTALNEETSNSKTAVEKMMTEDELISKLNDQGKAMYKSLSPKGKKLALQIASQACKGQNTCKGLNSCKSAKNSCAGQGGCAGQSTCAFKDKNLAVKVAAKKMAEKRAMMNQ